MLPVGGIKEKVLAARRAGLHTVILPKQNEKHVNEDLTDELRQGLTVHYVDEMDEVLKLALLAARRRAATTARLHRAPTPTTVFMSTISPSRDEPAHVGDA